MARPHDFRSVICSLSSNPRTQWQVLRLRPECADCSGRHGTCRLRVRANVGAPESARRPIALNVALGSKLFVRFNTIATR